MATLSDHASSLRKRVQDTVEDNLPTGIKDRVHSAKESLRDNINARKDQVSGLVNDGINLTSKKLQENGVDVNDYVGRVPTSASGIRNVLRNTLPVWLNFGGKSSADNVKNAKNANAIANTIISSQPTAECGSPNCSLFNKTYSIGGDTFRISPSLIASLPADTPWHSLKHYHNQIILLFCFMPWVSGTISTY